MSKIIPVLPSFDAWQRAANKLLTLETALAHGRRVVPAPELAMHLKLETAAVEARVVADQLFQIAYAEVNLTRKRRQAPAALACVQ
jgi:hypothetical protein